MGDGGPSRITQPEGPEAWLFGIFRTSLVTSFSADLDPKTAGQVLGHSRTAQTDRYLHVLEDRKSVAAGRIAEALFGQQRRKS